RLDTPSRARPRAFARFARDARRTRFPCRRRLRGHAGSPRAWPAVGTRQAADSRAPAGEDEAPLSHASTERARSARATRAVARTVRARDTWPLGDDRITHAAGRVNRREEASQAIPGGLRQRCCNHLHDRRGVRPAAPERLARART